MAEHQWVGPHPPIRWVHCAVCGIIKPIGTEPKACKGPVKIGLRAEIMCAFCGERPVPDYRLAIGSVSCPTCDGGKNVVEDYLACPTCDGSGDVDGEKA
jgi:hypothetical protein